MSWFITYMPSGCRVTVLSCTAEQRDLQLRGREPFNGGEGACGHLAEATR